jgi:protein-L-isoaspartate(D-aspartate) O-methyltransferase
MAEMGFEKARELMVSTQIEGRDVKDPRVLKAMREVPRHLFVPESLRERAYDDMAMPIGEGQTISQPYMVAKMTELLDLKGTERVLEIGTGSGYQTAVLAALAGEVFTIERIESLTELAKASLKAAGVEGVNLLVGDGTLGWPDEAPFDRVLITAGTPDIPEPIVDQLSEGGIIVVPVGPLSSQQLLRALKQQGSLKREPGIFCVFVPLIGKYGWENGRVP